MSLLLANLYWIVPALIVLVCVGFGIRDFGRFRPGRVMAIADACFTESLRRKVLLVTPLAIIGVIVVVQLQEPANQQDAIRQTARFCLFASGLVVAVTAIILACTNLPREIENRVIYTIVTKPTTRLEIVLGKVVGFAGVSAAILLIMGIFTFGYLEIRNRQLVSEIKAQLESRTLPADSPLRPTLAYYASAGLLATKSLDRPVGLQVFSFPPGQHDREHVAGYQYAGGGVGSFFTVPFEFTDVDIDELQKAQAAGAPLILKCDFQIIQRAPSEQQKKDIKMLGLRPRGGKPSDIYGPIVPATPSAHSNPSDFWPVPTVQVRVLDAGEDPLTEFGQLDGRGIEVPTTGQPGYLTIKPDVVEKLMQRPRFFLEFSAATPAVEYGVNAGSVSLCIPDAEDTARLAALVSAPNQADQEAAVLAHIGEHPAAVIRSAANAEGGQAIDFRARATRYGEQLISRKDGSGPVADFHFDNVELPGKSGDDRKLQVVPFELAVTVERSGEFDVNGANLSRMSIQIYNRKTGQTSAPIELTPELERANYVEVPRADLEGGNFDLLVRGLTDGQLIDLKPESASLITADRSFAFNLFKSLFILWMLSLLVVIISVFCSTFLSWPIAVVLTLVILLGHWGVSELGDAMAPGVGRSVTVDFQLRDPVSSKVVSTSVDKLAGALRLLSAALPDVSKFPVIDDIEQNVSISMASVEQGVGVLLMFGLPLLLLSYIILKNKEVAP